MRLTKTEKFSYLLNVGTIDQCDMIEIALLLFGLLSQNMTMISMLSFNFTRSGKSESFFGTGISLNFWHFLCILNYYYNKRLREIPNTDALFLSYIRSLRLPPLDQCILSAFSLQGPLSLFRLYLKQDSFHLPALRFS